jgi:hypothetical protein
VCIWAGTVIKTYQCIVLNKVESLVQFSMNSPPLKAEAEGRDDSLIVPIHESTLLQNKQFLNKYNPNHLPAPRQPWIAIRYFGATYYPHYSSVHQVIHSNAARDFFPHVLLPPSEGRWKTPDRPKYPKLDGQMRQVFESLNCLEITVDNAVASITCIAFS